ncbi:malonate decarboxylase subunit epsilon [Beijerinckia sp. L45]|uniref:malonate decarboxylase subunit epsilon n=1 Tax=Beijerinckia sp. L45 TaxID=1641855 RepID=UPI00131A6F3C|nr:malonate decarboxylase subunit epsilon [Beijerinckia sp. L45]
MRGTLAILCSGQGGQHAGMFDLVAGSAEAEPVFAAAAALLGQDPRRFVREAEHDALFTDRVGQILCCTQAMAAWAALGDSRPTHATVAGYSVGELAAWGCAGSLTMPTTLKLAEKRAAAMDAVAPEDGGLAAIVGLRRPRLEASLEEHGTTIAIINGIDSFVIGGHRAALTASCTDAQAAGATHTVMLRVAIPSHTPLLAAASPVFRRDLEDVAPSPPSTGFRLLSGVDGDEVLDVGAGCDKLGRQISTPIDWEACLDSCRSSGAARALELGPGNALSRMAASFFPDGHARSTADFRTLAGLKAWLAREDA